MSKSIVIYNSRGGNTEKVASSIAEGLETEAVNSDQIPDLSDYNLIVVGTWVAGGKPSGGGKEYLSKLDSEQLKDKKMVLFFTAGGVDNSPNASANIKKTMEQVFAEMEEFVKDKAEVVEERLAIRGAFRLFRFGPGLFSRGHPNEEELQHAKEFGESLKKYLN